MTRSPLKRLAFVTLCCVLLAIVSTAPTVASETTAPAPRPVRQSAPLPPGRGSVFYEFELIANADAVGADSFEQGISINEEGLVAFIANSTINGTRTERILVGDGSGPLRTVTDPGEGFTFPGFVNLRGSTVAAQVVDLFTSPISTYIRLYDLNDLTGEANVVAKGKFVDRQAPLPDYVAWDYDVLFGPVSMGPQLTDGSYAVAFSAKVGHDPNSICVDSCLVVYPPVASDGDFYEQETGESGQMRPDVIIRLPGDKQVIVDAKTPCEAYLEAIETDDQEIKENKMKHHARQVRQHVMSLGKKAYWQNFQPTPEFVVLFIPSDNFFSSALEFDPTLIEVGVEQGVIIATPTTLIGLLRAIAYGWKQEKLSLHAEQVSKLGHELYKRITDMGEHWSKVGRSLASSVDAYNKAVGSLESRVLVSARKFKEMGAAPRSIELETLEGIDRIPREIQADDMKLSLDTSAAPDS